MAEIFIECNSHSHSEIIVHVLKQSVVFEVPNMYATFCSEQWKNGNGIRIARLTLFSVLCACVCAPAITEKNGCEFFYSLFPFSFTIHTSPSLTHCQLYFVGRILRLCHRMRCYQMSWLCSVCDFSHCCGCKFLCSVKMTYVYRCMAYTHWNNSYLCHKSPVNKSQKTQSSFATAVPTQRYIDSNELNGRAMQHAIQLRLVV